MPDFYGNEPTVPSLSETLPEGANLSDLRPQTLIGEKEIKEAAQKLSDYKAGKGALESRVVKDEQWWKLRHWDILRHQSPAKITEPEPTSAWLFNAILNKHADAMDNYPLPVVLPRERSDEESADTLTKVMPVIMEYNNFEDTYSMNWWEKLKHGTGVYGVFWNPEKENGLGDIDIKQIDLLKIFWEPGIMDIQKSENLFIVELVSQDALDRQYPEHKGEFKGQGITIAEYVYDDTVDTSDKSVVVDWYYKRRLESGKTIVHYCKFCNNVVLYASENEPEYRERGFYDHGQYPVVFDTMFPEKGTPVGFGYIAITKDPQMYIDKLSQNLMMSSMMGTRKRFFISDATNINEEEFLDWNRPLVHTSGEINDSRIREIEVAPPAPIYKDLMDSKINEMKETAANRDVSSGGAQSGVTAAAAIAALQEAGNKVSRDMIAASYRSYNKIVNLCIELIRQFYDEVRAFRITGDAPGMYEYTTVSNLMMQGQQTGVDTFGNPLFRMPVFDLKTKAVRKSPFSRMEENERAKELYAMGFFNPERAQEAMGALEMMEFEGIDAVRENIAQGQTLLNIVQQQQAEMAQMASIIERSMGIIPAQPAEGGSAPRTPMMQAPSSPSTDREQTSTQTQGHRMADEVMAANKASMTSYGQRLAKRSEVSLDAMKG